jgi:hypothetical protein
VETESEEKIAVLSIKAKKIKLDSEPVKEKPVPVISQDKPLKPGDAVKMIDTQAAGEVIEIKDKDNKIVAFNKLFFQRSNHNDRPASFRRVRGML